MRRLISIGVNHQPESWMQEICQSGSEGGAKLTFVPTPISAQGGGFAKPWVPVTKKREALKEGKILCKRRAIEQSRPTKMTITCGVAYFLPSDTQGSAKPPPRPRQAYVAAIRYVYTPKSQSGAP
jgi:hypothetical protein